jgi:hypothetical protein
MCIPPPPPRASANVLGTVNAIASAIVVYFMAISFTCDIGDDRTLTTKFFFRRARGCSLEAHLAGFSFIPFQLPFSQCVSLRSASNARSTCRFSGPHDADAREPRKARQVLANHKRKPSVLFFELQRAAFTSGVTCGAL